MDMTQTPIRRLLLKLSPPVMLALLIQSVYNIVDSFFVARYSEEGLTALSIVYPIQLLMTAFATGIGAGVNLLISRLDGQGERGKQSGVVTCGLVLALIHSLLFAVLEFFLADPYFRLSSANELVNTQGVTYTNIIFAGSLGIFVESICTKILQARGNMVLPMAAQVMGAVVNMILDPILIFGLFGAPCLGIAGAAVATVLGQWLAMVITLIAVRRIYPRHGRWNRSTCFQIYQNGIGSIVTQSLYTLYMVGLNMILALFSEDAVTVLGIYYKIQSFFFIPLLGFQQVLLPVISHNFGAGQGQRIRQTVRFAVVLSTGLMLAASFVFLLFPRPLLTIFSGKKELLQIGAYALRVISLSFVPAGITIVVTSHLQGIAKMKLSVFVIVLRQVVLLVPLAWFLHFAGLKAVWWTFPLTELIAAAICIMFERSKRADVRLKALELRAEGMKSSEVAQATGFHAAYVTTLVAKYRDHGLEAISGNHYGGNHRNLSIEEEVTILAHFKERAEKGELVEISEMKAAYQQAIGHSIGTSQIYSVLHRHGWRKVMPRSRHPKKASEEVIETSKK